MEIRPRVCYEANDMDLFSNKGGLDLDLYKARELITMKHPCVGADQGQR